MKVSLAASFIATIFAGTALPAHACEVLETRMVQTDLFVSATRGSSSGKTNGFDGLNVLECKGGYLQLAQGAMLPHPALDGGLMYRETDVARAPVCSATEGPSSRNIPVSEVARAHVDLARACVGMQVRDLGRGGAIEIVPNGQCDVVERDASQGLVVLKGENCLLKPGKAGIQVRSVVLPSCSSFLPQAKVNEVDLVLAVNYSSALGADASPEGLAAKPVRLTISNDGGSKSHVASSKKSPTGFPVLVSNEYRLGFQLSSLTLQGSTETGLQAETRYLVDRAGSNAVNSNRLPFVVKNEMFLAKKGSESQFLGSWYNGSVVPAGFVGRDGSAGFNRLFEAQSPGRLNSTAKQIAAGDMIVLVSRLGNPNTVTRQFSNYLQELLKRRRAAIGRKSTDLATTLDNTQLPTLDTLKVLEEIKGLTPLRTLADLRNAVWNDVAAIVDWPVRFAHVCINDRCGDANEVIEGYEIQSLYEVESADFEVSLKLRQQLVKWNGRAEPKTEKNTLSEVQCN